MKVAAVAPDVWAVRLPMDGPLDHVFVYVLETPTGVVLVDTGPHGAEAERELATALEAIGAGLSQVQGVVATHAHTDHYGLAAAVRDASGAWVALHPADGALAIAGRAAPRDVVSRETAWLEQLGVPAAAGPAIIDSSIEWHEHAPTAQPDIELRDGVPAPVPGWKLTVVHTPGHTPGHVCLLDEGRRLLFAGDHVLPRITPNVALYAGESGNPLGTYLRSLASTGARVGRDVLVLPGHEGAITAFGERVGDLIAHHEAHLDAVARLVAAGAETVWNVAQRMPWSRPWDRIAGLMRNAALGEAHAHLVELASRGRVSLRSSGPPLLYETSERFLETPQTLYTDQSV